MILFSDNVRNHSYLFSYCRLSVIENKHTIVRLIKKEWTLNMLDKNSADDISIFFYLFFLENGLWHFDAKLIF